MAERNDDEPTPTTPIRYWWDNGPIRSDDMADPKHNMGPTTSKPQGHVHERGHRQESYFGSGTSRLMITTWQCEGCEIREPEAWWDGYEQGARDATSQ